MEIYLNKLKLVNFWCFGECAVEFHQRLTVLVGDNGLGKTALLEAAALALGEFVDALTGHRQSGRLSRRDVRVATSAGGNPMRCLPTRVEVAGAINRRPVSWAIQRGRRRGTAQSPRLMLLRELHGMTTMLRARLDHSPESAREFVLPVVAYYRSSRFSRNDYFGDGSKTRYKPLEGRLSGYRICLDPLSDSIHFNKWYRRMWESVRDASAFGARHLYSPLQLLTAVRGAVAAVLTTVSKDAVIDWDKSSNSVIADIPGAAPMPLGMLSTGVRNTIALVADLAHRCARLNPGLGGDAASLTPGVVLIDEVDLHLHPGWQQEVVAQLQMAFPNVQFIITTHSPQVLSTVHTESIRTIKLLDGIGRVESPRFQTRGVESAEVLAAVMDVDPVPRVPEAKWLSDYRALLYDGQYETDEAKALWARLVNHFGEDHPAMADVKTLRRLQDFKRANNLLPHEGEMS